MKNWTSHELVMVIGSACLVIFFLESIGPPNCLPYQVYNTFKRCGDVVQSL